MVGQYQPADMLSIQYQESTAEDEDDAEGQYDPDDAASAVPSQ